MMVILCCVAHLNINLILLSPFNVSIPSNLLCDLKLTNIARNTKVQMLVTVATHSIFVPPIFYPSSIQYKNFNFGHEDYTSWYTFRYLTFVIMCEWVWKKKLKDSLYSQSYCNYVSMLWNMHIIFAISMSM